MTSQWQPLPRQLRETVYCLMGGWLSCKALILVVLQLTDLYIDV